MDDDSDRSSEATQLEEHTTAEDTMHHDHDDDDDQSDATPLQYSPLSPEEDSATSQSLTLAVSDLSEVPVKYEMQRDELERLKNQLQGSHQEALATVIAQAARAHSRIQISNSQGQNQLNNADVAEAEVKQNDTIDVPRSLSASHNVKTQIDGYNWRKYGQKQVKSPQGSRSYYKCTYSDCDAKKMESCDEYNSVTKLVYKGQHKHDPPKKMVSNGGKILSSQKRKSISTPGLNSKEHRLSNSQQNQRVKKSNGESHGCVLKHPKNPKKPNFIVHAADDVEISADGYRWRKYGQKMVKGNPHPRNYYKCTCAGCGVTKHIEKAIDGTSNIVITYKGVHDHDKPVPKKRRGHAHAHGVVTFSPSSNILSTEVSGSESVKRIESTPTLVSVGFEIK